MSVNNINLYRKYRPQSFNEIQGQEFVVRTLKNSIINNKLSHAYILSGSRGVGKTSIAKIFAKALNCLNSIDGDCCNKCNNCLSINNAISLDVVEIDAASNNGVADVRNLIDNINYLPISLKYKVYIIDEAHMLTNGAWNALLKTIEDPPKHLLFVFATTEPHKIPLTIISRCQKFSLYNLSLFELENMIKRICEIENIKIKNDAIKKISYIADGSARDCLTLLGQIDTYTNSDITVEAINQVFGLLDLDKKIEFINNIVGCKFEKIIESIKEFEFKGIDFYQLAIEIIEILFDKLIYEKTNNDTLLKVLSKLNLGLIVIDSKQLVKLIEVWQDGLFKIKTNSNPKFYFELTCLTATKVFDFDLSINTSSIDYNKQTQINDEDLKISSNNITPEIKVSLDSQPIKKVSEGEFSQVLFDNVVTKKIYGNSNEINNINYIKLSNNKTENNSLEKLSNISESIVEKEKCVEKNVDHISTPAVLDVSNIIKKSISTTPFFEPSNVNDVINKTLEKNSSKKKKVDEFKEVNLFNMQFDDLDQQSSDLNVKEEIEQVTNVEENKIKDEQTKLVKEDKFGERQKIIDDFKNNLKTITRNTSITKVSKPNELEKGTINNVVNIIEYGNDQKFNIFCKIADNKNNDVKEKINTIFLTIKDKMAKTLEEGYFVNASKILLASNNGVIILFDEQIACKNLNSNSNNVNFLRYLKEKFKGVYLFLALTKNEAQDFANKYKEYLKENNRLDDVNIDDLLDKINKKETIKDLAVNMLGDLIEEE
ncbi:DNA polymerase III subunit gamma/tau [Malacoplasma muris]|uniref:DNA polymerase III subunit gamma/tau n=1 Tax=Malacoplasma muris TaxID=2119 RepID=UPI00398EBECE